MSSHPLLSGKQIARLFDADSSVRCEECFITKHAWEVVLGRTPYQNYLISTVGKRRHFRPYICSWDCFVHLRMAKRINCDGLVISRMNRTDEPRELGCPCDICVAKAAAEL